MRVATRNGNERRLHMPRGRCEADHAGGTASDRHVDPGHHHVAVGLRGPLTRNPANVARLRSGPSVDWGDWRCHAVSLRSRLRYRGKARSPPRCCCGGTQRAGGRAGPPGAAPASEAGGPPAADHRTGRGRRRASGSGRLRPAGEAGLFRPIRDVVRPPAAPTWTIVQDAAERCAGRYFSQGRSVSDSVT